MVGPAFTVVVPCWRAESVVGTAIASVLSQTERDFELVVVDDGSPDDTVRIAETAFGGDGRCRVASQPNSGPSAARNLGVSMGTGDIVAFLDADDRWHPGLLAAHRAHFAARPRMGASFSRIAFLDADLSSAGRVSAHVPDASLRDVLGENPSCSASALAVRRRAFEDVGGFDVGMVHAEDQEFLARILATTGWGGRRLARRARRLPHLARGSLLRHRQDGGGMVADDGAGPLLRGTGDVPEGRSPCAGRVASLPGPAGAQDGHAVDGRGQAHGSGVRRQPVRTGRIRILQDRHDRRRHRMCCAPAPPLQRAAPFEVNG